jgi:hypothetical protein
MIAHCTELAGSFGQSGHLVVQDSVEKPFPVRAAFLAGLLLIAAVVFAI